MELFQAKVSQPTTACVFFTKSATKLTVYGIPRPMMWRFVELDYAMVAVHFCSLLSSCSLRLEHYFFLSSSFIETT